MSSLCKVTRSKNRSVRRILITAAASLALWCAGSALAAETVKVGILHSLSGTMAISETVLKDVALMAIDEINADGGVRLCVCRRAVGCAPARRGHRLRLGMARESVTAALKVVPLGQTDGQRLLLALGARLDAIVAGAAALADEDLTTFAPRLAILSMRHETQYSRLFRS